MCIPVLQIGAEQRSTIEPYAAAKASAMLNRDQSHGKSRMLKERLQSYTCVVFQVPAAKADDAAGILVAYGALGCEVKAIRSRHQPGGKKVVNLCAYFRSLTAAGQRRIESLIQGLTVNGVPTVTQHLVDPGWATLWQTRFAPLPIGRRFLIVPPWRQLKDKHRLTIVIRPGQAFGTGHHPSTFGALSMMEDWCETHRVERALDAGTGSGILAIAMRKLGVRQIVAIDIDEKALENARENTGLNVIDDPIRLSSAPLSSVRGRFDPIAANILSTVLIAMAPALKARLRPAGGLVLGGILKREVANVASAFTPQLRCVRSRTDRAWATLLMAQ